MKEFFGNALAGIFGLLAVIGFVWVGIHVIPFVVSPWVNQSNNNSTLQEIQSCLSTDGQMWLALDLNGNMVPTSTAPLDFEEFKDCVNNL